MGRRQVEEQQGDKLENMEAAGQDRTGEKGVEMIRKEISVLPGGSPRQTFEPWLRVPGENNVPGRPKDPVAQHHLQVKGKLRRDPEESPGVGVRCPLVDDSEGVRVEDHQGKEVANEVFSQAWLAAESMSRGHWIMLVVINEASAEGTIVSLHLKILVGLIFSLGFRCYFPSLLGGSIVVEGGPHLGVNLPS